MVDDEMKSEFRLFETIWFYYCNILPIEEAEFDICLEIINKIKKNDFDFNKENIEDFNKFLNIIIDYINETLYDDDEAFIYCYKIKNYLKILSKNVD